MDETVYGGVDAMWTKRWTTFDFSVIVESMPIFMIESSNEQSELAA
jgi:hypothetical protein